MTPLLCPKKQPKILGGTSGKIYVRGYNPPPGGEKRVADYESHCLHKQD